jgi:hypothetical protein
MRTHEFVLDTEARTAQGVVWKCRFCGQRTSSKRKETDSKKLCREAEEKK